MPTATGQHWLQVQWMKQYVAMLNKMSPQVGASKAARAEMLASWQCASAQQLLDHLGSPLPNEGRILLLQTPCLLESLLGCLIMLQIRQVNRRGTFFWRKPPPGPVPRKGLSKLIQQVGCPHLLPWFRLLSVVFLPQAED